MAIRRRLFDAVLREQIKEVGSPGRTRTTDQRINSPSLYQLSYRGTDSKGTAFCKKAQGKSRQFRSNHLNSQ